jgi:hypothetical protein
MALDAVVGIVGGALALLGRAGLLGKRDKLAGEQGEKA